MKTRLRTPFLLTAALALSHCAPANGPREDVRDAAADARASGAVPDASVEESRSHAADDNSDIDLGSDWRPTSRDEMYAGKTLDERALDWAHWNLSMSDCVDNPEADVDGALCALDQTKDSPVFFVAPGDYLTTRSNCRVSAEKAILVALDYFYADGVSSPFDDNVPPEMLENQARSIQTTMRDLTLVVDGQPIDDLESYAVGPLKFSQDLPSGSNYYVCSGYEDIVSPVDPIYLVGYFALLPPPGPGKHRVVFGGTYSYLGWDFVKRVNFTFSAE